MDDKTKILKLKVEENEVAILQRKDMFTVSLDTILLVNFIKIKNQTKTLIDFGTNNAAIPILLAKKYPIEIIGVEIQKEAVELAIKNVALNSLTNQIVIYHDDIKIYAQEKANKNQKVDIIVCNPPFFPVLQKTNLKLDPLKIAARHEIYIDLNTIISSAAKLLKDKGKLFMIYNIERLDELLLALKQYQFAVKRMQVVYPKIDKKANLVLIEAVFKTNVGMIVEPPLICHNQDNTYNSEIAKWYNRNNIK
ncbi:tRNA1(Val) (adenine(37)-N6)-methyltransferase [Spiroplasma platyhelix]|uniref:tRNA1(Val) (Adenine(37)-N6)-methyltransferase n=1 Tax=Spiroplasma platyhelix PALS-1 TaxID=1276218 RepID=A0A846U9M7_9MOLU|nr:tRNA1(Val) (adenine(37)-N6)-methyltransferase [Spiroplasma platyhelix]MBE4704200.1 tRNA1(Val) (adenine(37)-N6)-methyltransferase [Spiroplasma platyhelix PALS-1]NKE38573.1 tRNA1(Val) (adenine(37)-N6)-methyltransferase [Spiroplasma platyhelix PALS-1]UJB28784.1 methyltransferase [Spiroplasma platyhelix PALS-1]